MHGADVRATLADKRLNEAVGALPQMAGNQPRAILSGMPSPVLITPRGLSSQMYYIIQYCRTTGTI